MSDGRRVPHAEALAVAVACVELLRPVSQRVKVCGSLRRMKAEVSDIEILLEPLDQPADMFGDVEPDVAAVRRVCERMGEIVKGGGKYIQVALPVGMKLDLFLVTPPANWFVLLAIRTGPAALGQWAVTRMRDHGYRCSEGCILRGDVEVPTDSEADFFARARLACLPPRERDSSAAMKVLA